MKAYRLTPPAANDISEIWSFIARDDPTAADAVENAIFTACEFLAEAPLRGHVRPDLTGRALRFWTVPRFPNYTIVYDPAIQPLRVIRVLHGGRDLRRLLR